MDSTYINPSEKDMSGQPVDRLKLLYPNVDENLTPLPRSWSSQEKCITIGLTQNNLRVHYKGFYAHSIHLISILFVCFYLLMWLFAEFCCVTYYISYFFFDLFNSSSVNLTQFRFDAFCDAMCVPHSECSDLYKIYIYKYGIFVGLSIFFLVSS